MNEKFKQYFIKQGFTHLTPIQKATTMPLRNDENILGIAPTGSGKTLAYTLPLLEKLMPQDGTQLLILAPSQELAAQITKIVREWSNLINLKTISLIGGANIKRQIEKLKKHPEIVVGTSGRILELIEERKLKLHKLMSVVIDEADEMLEQKESMTMVREILSHAPARLQLVFFSATNAPIFKEFHHWFGVEPHVIDVSENDNTQGHVIHYLLETPTRKRVDVLRKLAHLKDMHALVFFNEKAVLEEVAAKLEHHHIKIATLSSNSRQIERQNALSKLKKGTLTFVLTTDIAARGIDIPNLKAVINYDIPKDNITYIHRAGRTCRMGANGIVINIGNEHDLRKFKKLMNKETLDIQNAYLFNGELLTTNLVVEKSKFKPKTSSFSKIKVKKRKKNRQRDRKNKGNPHYKNKKLD